MSIFKISRLLTGVMLLFALASCGGGGSGDAGSSTPTLVTTPDPVETPDPTPSDAVVDYNSIIPKPAAFSQESGSFTMDAQTRIYTEQNNAETLVIGQMLASHMNPATGFNTTVEQVSTAPTENFIYLSLSSDSSLGDEGYVLDITDEGVLLSAFEPEGLLRGMATLLQLLPPAIHSTSVQSSSWTISTGTITDTPRYAYRGFMIDVARHFHSVDELKRLMDIMVLYKLNKFHIHLTDDQGWRLEILSWPQLTTIGGSTEVGGGPGGFYTQAEFRELVEYADARYITLIPEVDMPGHTNAALASYAELNCDNQARELYTGIEVGFSSLCVGKAETSQFIRDVIGELAGLISSDYIHIGGDEADATSDSDYIDFINEARTTIENNGKYMMGWASIGKASLTTDTITQQWNPTDDVNVRLAANQGSSFVMSPADHIYLDMQYSEGFSPGLNWAGFNNVQNAYEWNPDTFISGISHLVIGVEAPLWSETIETRDHIDIMVFPRLLGLAEIGWTPQSSRVWSEYSARLASQGERLDALGISYYQSPLVAWP